MQKNYTPEKILSTETGTLTEAELKVQAKELFQEKKNDSSGDLAKFLLGAAGSAVAGSILHSLLATPSQRFKPTAATTAREIGEAIRLRREDISLSQVELATQSGTGARFVSEVERGKETAEIGKVLDLLDALGLEARIVMKS